MSKEGRRRHDVSFKLGVVRRIEAGESIPAVSRELGIVQTVLHRWRNAVRSGGERALRDPGRPRRDEGAPVVLAAAGELRDLRAAQRRIEALQRKIGEQEMALDFFERALRHIEASRRPSDGSGATTSSARSRR